TDHYLDVPLEALGEPLANGFRFLHNSSCFPRKGVDALLAAYGRYFSGRSDVVLIIKTFPNPHNDIAARVADFRAQFPAAPAVQLLRGDLSDGQMASLYANCQALVAPSRGEGFGLPLAEAMLRGIPVIATAYGGQMDFCSEETAYLVDYRFTYSQSHFEEPASIWVDPDVDALGKAMLEVIDGDVGKRQSRTAKARELLMQRFTWDAVAGRQSRAIAEIEAAPLGELLVAVRTAWISTWETRCGIASYSEFLTRGWHKDRLWVLADQQEAAPENLPNVRRCWRQGSADAGKQLLDAVLALDIDAAVIQYNFGFYPLQALAELVEGLVNRGKVCLLTLHATKDVDKPDFKASLGDIRDTLARCTRILVHSLADCNRLKQFGLVDNVTLFPHGAPAPQSLPARTRRGQFTVGTFGYALPHKGLREVIEACALLRQRGLDVALRMLNSRYPAAQSDEEIAACRALIASMLDDKHAEFDDAFHSDMEIEETLGRCDLLVFAYQETEESASGAIRVAMSAGVPILCTPLEIFDDVASAVDFSMESTPVALSASIAGFIDDASRG
ncbi:MAG: glycosyltransferase family 4 protein, partial [Rudaea sp.]